MASGVAGRLAWRAAFLAAAAGAVGAAGLVGRPAALAVLAAEAALFGAVLLWLPRAAHRRFRRGNFRGSSLLYRLLRRLRIDPRARASIDVSLAACEMAQGEYARALDLLGRVEPDRLEEASRAAWLNNRAYALARSEADPATALEEADRAIALRPDVGGFRHTRAVALLALGRLDEAIRELDAVWREQDSTEATALLEAERCYDIGRAWDRKGERDYARDYFERAHRAAPESTWAARAAAEIGSGARGEASLQELV